jgi:hypothetical protein
MTQAERSPQPSASQSASVWQYKPWWCQPWSILLTGVSIIGGSWYTFHLWWLTGLIALPILTWMGFFLILYPRLMAEEIAQAQASQTDDSVRHPTID